MCHTHTSGFFLSYRVHKWSRALKTLGDLNKEAEKAARDVRKKVRSVLSDEAAPNLVDDTTVALVGMLTGGEDHSQGFSHAKHAEVRK